MCLVLCRLLRYIPFIGSNLAIIFAENYNQSRGKLKIL